MIEAHTIWTDHRNQVVQVEVSFLTDAWEPLATSCRAIGPFDDPERATRQARQVAQDLARRQQQDTVPPTLLED